jgi:type III secretion protein L
MGLVFLIDRPDYRLATDRNVLKRGEATVIEHITNAYVRAQGEIASTLRNLQSVCAKATEDAYHTGLAKAEHDAAERWTLVEVERLALLQSMQPALAEMVVDALSLLAKGLDREALMARAMELFQGSLRGVSWARLRVHPDAVQVAEDALLEFSRNTGLGKLARVIADESLPQDGCVLESDLGKVDASLGAQLQAIRTATAEAARQMVGAATGRGTQV